MHANLIILTKKRTFRRVFVLLKVRFLYLFEYAV